MTEATTPETHAEELYAIVAARPPAEGRMQADAMMTAATALLINREGVDNTIAALGRLADQVRASRSAPGAPHPTPASASDVPDPEHLAAMALVHLRTLPVEVAMAQAHAALAAATAFLGEAGARPAAVTPGQASELAPALPPEQLACAIVDHLRGLHRGEAHERARAVVAGAAGYLHEVFGRTYASALLAGTLDAAKAYGDEVRGGRDTLDTLH